MRSPEGRDIQVRGLYREIVAPERIASSARREEDLAADAELLMTITFDDSGGKTRAPIHQAPFKSVAERDDAVGGWTESLERLANSRGRGVTKGQTRNETIFSAAILKENRRCS